MSEVFLEVDIDVESSKHSEEGQSLLKSADKSTIVRDESVDLEQWTFDLGLASNALLSIGCNAYMVGAFQLIIPAMFAGGEHLYSNLVASIIFLGQSLAICVAGFVYSPLKEERPVMMRLSLWKLPKELEWNLLANTLLCITCGGGVCEALLDFAQCCPHLFSLVRLAVAISFCLVVLLYSYAIVDGEHGRAPRPRNIAIFVTSTIDLYLVATACFGLGCIMRLLGVILDMISETAMSKCLLFTGAALRCLAGPFYIMSSVQFRDVDRERPMSSRHRLCLIETKHT